MSHFLYGVELAGLAFGIVYGWYRLMQWIGKH